MLHAKPIIIGAWLVSTVASGTMVVTWLAAVSPIIATGFGVYLTWRLRVVHKLVNEKSDVQDARIGQLTDAMVAAGIDVPQTTPKTGA